MLKNNKNNHFCFFAFISSFLVVVIITIISCAWQSTYFSFNFFIYPTDPQESVESLYIKQAFTPTCFRRCQDIAKNYYFGFLVFYTNMSEIKICLPRPPSRGKCHEMSFPRTHQNGTVLNRNYADQNHGTLNHSTMLTTKFAA